MTASDLRVERLNRGLTIDALAEVIKVAPHVLKHAERGGRPNPAAAKKIADFYGCKVTDIWPVSDEAAA